MDVMAERSLIDAKFDAITPRAISGLALAVHNLTKYFPKDEGYKHVFNDITFGVRCNDVFGLLGPNGAGKTTLINILTSKLNANRGEVKVFGYPSSEGVVKKLISVVPQFDVFFDELRVSDHLQLVARLHGVNGGRYVAAAKNLAKQVGLDRDAFSYVSSKLSGGQKRRLTLGMALMSEPKLLFMDEPTVGTELGGEE